MRWYKPIPSRLDAPFPSWMIVSAIFGLLWASHFNLLRLPYYWDEAGYYIPAAWDFLRTGSLIPVTTLTNAHPPLPSIYLALFWKIFGFSPLVTRMAVLAVASLSLTAVWRLAQQLIGVKPVVFWTVVLTGTYPIWFTQSSLAHADIFAAACVLWGMVYSLPEGNRKPWVAALWFAAAALCKETAIILPLTLALTSLGESLHTQTPARGKSLREAAWLGSCVLPLAAWYGWHYLKTGFLFGNPEFLRYNAQANLDLGRIFAALTHRVLHLTAHMNLFVPVLMAVAALLLKPRPEVEGKAILSGFALRRIVCLMLVNLFFFSILGGALLTRYLLPIYPLVLLIAVATLYRRVSYWQGLAAFSAAAFIAGLLVNPWYGFAPEDNLTYARVVRLHQAGIAQLNARYPGATVLTAWPMSDELTRPELGYLQQPYEVETLTDFASSEIARAAEEPEKYSVALVFSTKIDPVSSILSLGAKSKADDERYFGLHHDLQPEAIAHKLGGKLVWKQEDQGQWIALIRFNRQFEAEVPSAGEFQLAMNRDPH